MNASTHKNVWLQLPTFLCGITAKNNSILYVRYFFSRETHKSKEFPNSTAIFLFDSDVSHFRGNEELDTYMLRVEPCFPASCYSGFE